jgi:HEAT repeat protein
MLFIVNYSANRSYDPTWSIYLGFLISIFFTYKNRNLLWSLLAVFFWQIFPFIGYVFAKGTDSEINAESLVIIVLINCILVLITYVISIFLEKKGKITLPVTLFDRFKKHSNELRSLYLNNAQTARQLDHRLKYIIAIPAIILLCLVPPTYFVFRDTNIKAQTERGRISRRSDNNFWQACLDNRSIELFNEYLRLFPDGEHVKEAKDIILELQSGKRISSLTPVIKNNRLEGYSTDKLIEALKSNDFDLKIKAILRLGEKGNRKAVEPLINCLNEWKKESPILVITVIMSLGNLKDSRVTPCLLEILENTYFDNTTQIGIATTNALLLLNDASSVQPLIDILEMEIVELRNIDDRDLSDASYPLAYLNTTLSNCIELLGNIGDLQATNVLIKYIHLHIKDNRDIEKIKISAVNALMSLDFRLKYQIVGTLLETLKGQNKELREINKNFEKAVRESLNKNAS